MPTLSPQKRARNRDALGAVIKSARLKVGLTQKELADAVGLKYYTMISQLELGYISIPPSLWVPLATTLKINVEDWVTMCLEEIQPEVYAALFGDATPSQVQECLKVLKNRNKS